MARIYTLGIGRKRVYHLPKKVDKNELKFGTQDSSDWCRENDFFKQAILYQN